MERPSYHLLVILMSFSLLIISSTAVPSTRNQRLLKGNGDLPALGDTLQTQVTTEEGQTEEVINGRMDLATNDYPGSGPNNRHTPPGRQ